MSDQDSFDNEYSLRACDLNSYFKQRSSVLRKKEEAEILDLLLGNVFYYVRLCELILFSVR